MELIACLSSGKGTWGHVSHLIAEGEWDKIFLLTNEFGKENFTCEKEHEFILFNTRVGLEEMRDSVIAGLKGKIKGTEVAINLVSGIGKEHMAIISAVLKLGVGVRFMAITAEGIKEL